MVLVLRLQGWFNSQSLRIKLKEGEKSMFVKFGCFICKYAALRIFSDFENLFRFFRPDDNLASLKRGGSRCRWGCHNRKATVSKQNTLPGSACLACSTDKKTVQGNHNNYPVQALAGEGTAGAALQATSPPMQLWDCTQSATM